ncbi:MAG: type I methionyl aminopeptidase [Candidatus Eremiobacteraeota bacterium]|nr:type I methionyl aminopeptidase [Candidatus Eremiobacteraeota bacterium]
MIILKSDDEIALMRESGHITATVLEELRNASGVGVTTRELDRIADSLIVKMGARPAFKGYKGYPSATTISLNDEVVHSIPNKRKLKSGDVVSIDMGVFYRDYCSDAAITVAIGDVEPEKLRLMQVTRESLYKGIRKAVIGNRLGDVSSGIQEHVESNGFSVVRDLVGHGIGRAMHEEPQVPNYGTPGIGPLLRKGMVLALEPMVNLGTYKVAVKRDNWTVVTEDGKCSAHFEHTVAVTEKGPRILTLPHGAAKNEEYPFS